MEHLDSKAALLETVQALRDELDGVVAEAGAERATRPGGFGEWTLKDVITHLTGWRWRTVARLEAGRHGGEPANPWPDHLDEEHDLDEINHWFFETSRDKTLDQVLRESRETFARVERAIAALPERDLLEPGRFTWLPDLSLGPAVVRGTFEHYHVEHESEIRAWLDRG